METSQFRGVIPPVVIPLSAKKTTSISRPSTASSQP